MRIFLYIILLLTYFNYKNLCSQDLTLKYEIKSYIGASTDEEIPFWIKYHDENNTVDGDNVFGYFKTNIYKEYDRIDDKKADFAFGCSVKSNVGEKFSVYIQEIYSKIKFKKIEFFAGMQKRPYSFEKLSSTNGDFLYSNFTRPYPNVTLSLPNYIDIPFTKGLLAFKILYSEGLLIDDRYVKNSRVHHKYGYLRFGKNKKWKFEIGLQHYAQWGGKSPNTNIGKLPNNFDAYLDIVLAKNNSEYDPLYSIDINDEIDRNRLGNHFGMIDLRLYYELKKMFFKFYRQVIFEDSSGMNLFNRDALMGLFIKLKQKDPWVQTMLYEFYHTKYQSGSMAGGSPKPQGGVWTGRDNYFNHSIYRSGWTYYGNTIGTPFFTPNFQEESISYGVNNNRIIANHLGLSGFLFNKLPYKFLLSYVQNFGTYHQEIDKDQISIKFETQLLKHNSPFEFNIGIAADMKDYLGDKFGMYFVVRKSGIIK